MLKRWMAFLLAAALVLGMAGTAFAEGERAVPVDSGAANGKTELQLEYTFVPEELERALVGAPRAELGGPDGLWSTERGVASYSAVGNYFGNALTGNARIFYDQWLLYFQTVTATGSGRSLAVVKGLNIQSNEELSVAINAAYSALLKDHTELLYWMNKALPARSAGEWNEIHTVFSVIEPYRGAAEGTDFYTKTEYHAINAGANNRENAERVAAEIVAQASGLATDYDKARYFNRRICELTEYDWAAVEPGTPYDDSFQWVDVFNGKLVVCEGYAKAFKYLCDKAEIGCFLVDGTMGSGNHMWNLVELGGRWYLVDCTNNDVPSALGNYSEWLFAIGLGNAEYQNLGYDPLYYSSGDAVPLNPDNVLLSVEDYTPGAQAQEHAVTVKNGTASVQRAKVGALVTVNANAVTGQAFTGWTSEAGVTFASPASAQTTFVMPDRDVTVTAGYRSTGGGGGSGGGSSGGGGGSSGGAVETPAPSEPEIYAYDVTAVASKTQSAVADAIAKALAEKKGAATASIVLENAKGVTPELCQGIVEAARAACAGKSVTVKPLLVCDTVTNGKVLARLTLDPAKSTLKTELQVGVVVGNPAVEERFAKYYANTVRVVRFGQTGAFGTVVNAAVKVDLAGLNAKSLRFYNYNAATNSYMPMPYPAYFVDANGYLHFSTALGNDVIVTDRPLAAK